MTDNPQHCQLASISRVTSGPEPQRESVHILTRSELEQSWEAIEAAIDSTDGIDPWCSGPDWTLSVSAGFAPRGKHLYLRSSNGHGFALFGYYRDLPRTLLLSSIEPLWGFACPLFGPDIEALAAEVAVELGKLPHWSSLIIPGLPPLPHPTGTVNQWHPLPLLAFGRSFPKAT